MQVSRDLLSTPGYNPYLNQAVDASYRPIVKIRVLHQTGKPHPVFQLQAPYRHTITAEHNILGLENTPPPLHLLKITLTV